MSHASHIGARQNDGLCKTCRSNGPHFQVLFERVGDHRHYPAFYKIGLTNHKAQGVLQLAGTLTSVMLLVSKDIESLDQHF